MVGHDGLFLANAIGWKEMMEPEVLSSNATDLREFKSTEKREIICTKIFLRLSHICIKGISDITGIHYKYCVIIMSDCSLDATHTDGAGKHIQTDENEYNSTIKIRKKAGSDSYSQVVYISTRRILTGEHIYCHNNYWAEDTMKVRIFMCQS